MIRIREKRNLVSGRVGTAITFADDGPGIAWERLRIKARDLNLPHERQEDLIQAMFADGVSSKDEASNVSGRGEGLSALRATVRALGGQLAVASPSTGGTTWTFRLPFEERSEPPLAKSAPAALSNPAAAASARPS